MDVNGKNSFACWCASAESAWAPAYLQVWSRLDNEMWSTEWILRQTQDCGLLHHPGFPWTGLQCLFTHWKAWLNNTCTDVSVLPDANKQAYDQYYELCLKLLRVGGVVGIDNTLWGGDVANPEVRSPWLLLKFGGHLLWTSVIYHILPSEWFYVWAA